MKQNEFEKSMSAAAFAEAGEHDTAKEMMTNNESQKSNKQSLKEKKPYGKMVIFGAISLSAYIALLANQEWVTETFTKGGINTVWPIGAAFFFSFIHGAFASNFLSVLGIEAKK
ncbi:MAG: hypothetical protein OEM02_14835 [Desulfobulbaceae bacterium]|nr:hypothetical protein [Desulfobulbaceae bacterium]